MKAGDEVADCFIVKRCALSTIVSTPQGESYVLEVSKSYFFIQ